MVLVSVQKKCVSFCSYVFFVLIRPPPASTLFPYTTLFRSLARQAKVSPWFFRGSARIRLPVAAKIARSEEHTSELQSRLHLVCRLLLEKKNHAKRCKMHTHSGTHPHRSNER